MEHRVSTIEMFLHHVFHVDILPGCMKIGNFSCSQNKMASSMSGEIIENSYEKNVSNLFY